MYKILVIDSENLVAEVCRAGLYEPGHKVVAADNVRSMKEREESSRVRALLEQYICKHCFFLAGDAR